MSRQMPPPPTPTEPARLPSSEQGKKPAWKRWWIWVGIVVIIGIIGSAGDGSKDEGSIENAAPVAGVSSPPSPEVVGTPLPSPATPIRRVRVPNVVGDREASGTRTLESASFTVIVDERYSNQPDGTILDQDLRAGRRADEHSAITLLVAKALPRLPNVIGLGLEHARRALEERGFEVRVVHETSSQRKDSVIRMSPPAGSGSRPGSTVTIVVAKPAPAPPPSTSSGGGCTPGYSPCLPPASDYDCAGGSGDGPKYTGTVTVTGSDPYDLDSDNDGVGCE